MSSEKRSEGAPVKEAQNILAETNKELPLSEEHKVVPKRRPKGSKAKGIEKIHPMAVGLKEAKAAIANVLQNTNNLGLLASCLQEEFDKDPTKFLRQYEPLLRRYEAMSKESVGTPSHVNVMTGVVIQTDREEVRVRARTQEDEPIDAEYEEVEEDE